MQKKLLSLLLIFTTVLSFSACKKENRFDFSELLIRTEDFYGEKELSLENAFFSENKWFLFLSICETDDMLITAKEEEDTKYLLSVSVTVLNTGNDGQREAFVKMCKAVIRSFMPERNIDELAENIALSDIEAVFSDEVYFYTEGRYKLSLFNSEQSSTMIIELVY